MQHRKEAHTVFEIEILEHINVKSIKAHFKMTNAAFGHNLTFVFFKALKVSPVLYPVDDWMYYKK